MTAPHTGSGAPAGHFLDEEVVTVPRLSSSSRGPSVPPPPHRSDLRSSAELQTSPTKVPPTAAFQRAEPRLPRSKALALHTGISRDRFRVLYLFCFIFFVSFF